MKQLSWIKNFEIGKSNLILGVEKGEEKIPMVIEFARDHDIKVTSISVRKPTLDDAFLHYTGRSIREDNAPAQRMPPPRFRRR